MPPQPAEKLVGDALLISALTGGYPEVVQRHAPERQRKWCLDYIATIMQRDVKDIAGIQRLAELPHLLRILAASSGKLVNLSAAGAALRLHHTTVGNYLTVLEHLYLVERLPPWFSNEFKRLVKTPKLHFFDSGILAAMRGLSLESLRSDRTPAEALLETFVHNELRKQAAWHPYELHFYHYLDKDQAEVDFIVENSAREVVGIEVKAAATVRSGDFAGLKKLQSATGSQFRCGVVLYDGEHLLPFGDRLFAVPFPSL